jgi:anti-sigma-K factor RskA
VTDSLGHREHIESLAAYALGALSDDEAARLRRHLDTCPDCRAELERLHHAVELLPASVEQVEPPPELKTRVMAVVESEAELLRAAGGGADLAAPGPRKLWPPAPRWRPALAFATALAPILAVVIALLLTTGGPATRTVEAQVSAPLRAVGAHASVRVNGTRAVLVVSGLPAPAADHVDELWVKHGQARPVPAGTFVVGSGSVEVARPVRRGDEVLVTVEPGRGTTAPTTTPLLVARV